MQEPKWPEPRLVIECPRWFGPWVLWVFAVLFVAELVALFIWKSGRS